MGYLADIYVIKKSRSKKLGIDFLNHFLPLREESAEEYLIPQYSDYPICEFDNAEDLMIFLESNPEYSQSIYWRNKYKNSLNKHGMIFYTKDGYMIFGISRDADMSGNLSTKNEDECLLEMMKYFETKNGYIDYETLPVNSYVEFIEVVNNFKK